MQFVFLRSDTIDAKAVTTICSKYKHSVIDAIIKVKQNTDEATLMKEFNKILQDIRNADALIVEGSDSLIDIGAFISNSLQQRKPVLMLHSDKTAPKVWMFTSNRLFNNKAYNLSRLDKLEGELKTFFNKTKKQKLVYRFNLMLNRELNDFLMDKAKENTISKADYIRQLIMQDMTDDPAKNT